MKERENLLASMGAQFTQQLLLGEKLCTFLFTERTVSDSESVYLVNILNSEVTKPFKMYLVDGNYEIMNENVPAEIKDIKFQLNQAINNYHVMQSLLSSLNMPLTLDDLNQVRNKNSI